VWLLNRVDDVTAYVADRVVRGKVEDGRDRVEHGEAQVHAERGTCSTRGQPRPMQTVGLPR
jgi:hypothetical protein